MHSVTVRPVRPVRPWHKDPKQSTRMEEHRVQDDQSCQYSAASHPEQDSQHKIHKIRWTDRWKSFFSNTRAEERPNRNERVSRSTAKQLQPESIQKPNETNTSLSCSALLSSAVLVLWDCWWCPQQSGDGRYCDELSGHAVQLSFLISVLNLVDQRLNRLEPTTLTQLQTLSLSLRRCLLVKALPSSNALSGAKCQWSESKGTYKNASWSNESAKFNLSRQPPGTQMKSPHCTTWFMSKST